ncbi:MAG TPA: hypothetical protein VG265_03475 [Gaiellaceae bacterium]|nr:hypothetical protein [Gaiellaceae bacterium]
MRAPVRRGILRIVGVAIVAALVLAPLAQSRDAAALSLTVTFFPNGTISVALPDGTAVGSQSGTPTSLPAGYYTVYLQGPGGCVELPYFDLQGPGLNVHNNLSDGEVMSTGLVANLLPSSTYTWRDEGTTPAVTHTFATSSDVVGTQPVSTPVTVSPAMTHPTTVTTQDVVGSKVPQKPVSLIPTQLAPARGSLVGTVTAAGKLGLLFGGRSVTTLKPGRYVLTVTDRSRASGFVLDTKNKVATTVTTAPTVGTRRVTITLTAGRWFAVPGAAQSGKLAFRVS